MHNAYPALKMVLTKPINIISPKFVLYDIISTLIGMSSLTRATICPIIIQIFACCLLYHTPPLLNNSGWILLYTAGEYCRICSVLKSELHPKVFIRNNKHTLL